MKHKIMTMIMIMLGAALVAFSGQDALAQNVKYGAGMTPVAYQDDCTSYMQEAEDHYGIPRGLLYSISLVESGLYGAPWPWTLNVNGQGLYAQSFDEASTYLRDKRGKPRKDVAIGCMQIHMGYHLDHFQSPEQALEPSNNVWYAASFLYALHQRHGSWTQAVAKYHANSYPAQKSYVCKVWKNYLKVFAQKPYGEGASYCRSGGQLAQK